MKSVIHWDRNTKHLNVKCSWFRYLNAGRFGWTKLICETHSKSGPLCCELSVTQDVILEGAPIWRVPICATEYWQLVTTYTNANLSRIIQNSNIQLTYYPSK